MKKKVLITICTPTLNNFRSASALPYHLILGDLYNARTNNSQIEYTIYSFNSNQVSLEQIARIEQELGVRIVVLPFPRWLQLMFKFHLSFLRIFLKYPLMSYLSLPKDVVIEIKKMTPDMLWIYGEEISDMAAQFDGTRIIITMPDCESLFYYRMLRQRWATRHLSQVLRYAFAYWQYKSMERELCQKAVIYHFVGKADAEFFKNTNPSSNAMFLRHPLYAYDESKKITFSQPKIKLLFAGRYDFYCEHGSNELLNTMIARKQDLIDKFAITFLGKGWEAWNKRLNTAGFVSSHIKFAPDYIEELQKHDIQINAIDVGTGTKGKVLDAISNGLLAFGTKYALENIAVRNGESCVQYSTVDEAIDRLVDICGHRNKYERIAEVGRRLVLREHDGGKIADKLFEITELK